jgi:hypothetical protein
MAKRDDFVKLITEGYTYKGEPNSGAAILAGETLGNASVKNTSKTLNRHGLLPELLELKNKKLFRFYLNSYLPFGIPG